MSGTLLRCLLAAATGVVPGVVIAFLWKPAPGIGVGAIGALAGLLMGAFRISPKRVGSLTLGILAAYNLGGFGDRAFEKLDDATQSEDQPPAQDVFQKWLLAEGIRHRRGWLVVVGMICGVIAGAVCCWFDAQRIAEGGTGLLLPLPGDKEPLVTQGIVATLGCVIWSGGLFGMFASAAYRRPVGLGVVVSMCLSLAIGIAASERSVTSPLGFAIMFSTAGIALALIVGLVAGAEDDPAE